MEASSLQLSLVRYLQLIQFPLLLTALAFVCVCVCRHDFVEVDDISESSTITWGPWCGRKAPSPIRSQNNMLRITFKSDDFFVAKPGFKLCYSLLVSHAHGVPRASFIECKEF